MVNNITFRLNTEQEHAPMNIGNISKIGLYYLQCTNSESNHDSWLVRGLTACTETPQGNPGGRVAAAAASTNPDDAAPGRRTLPRCCGGTALAAWAPGAGTATTAAPVLRPPIDHRDWRSRSCCLAAGSGVSRG